VKTILDLLRAHNGDSANSMHAFLILSVDRRNTAAEAEEVMDLAIKYKSSGVVGVDLCGNPLKGDVHIFTDAFAQARVAGLKITLHFAETEASAADEELEALLSWRPDRLGHVIHVKEKYRQAIEKQNIGVELCLSCNVHAKMITGSYPDHHFGMWRHSTVSVALCVSSDPAMSCRSWCLRKQTDDVGVFCSPLSQEYYLAALHFELDRKQVKELCERAVDSIFTGDEERLRLGRIYSEWEGWDI
jgi:adenosine deaminase